MDCLSDRHIPMYQSWLSLYRLNLSDTPCFDIPARAAIASNFTPCFLRLNISRSLIKGYLAYSVIESFYFPICSDRGEVPKSLIYQIKPIK